MKKENFIKKARQFHGNKYNYSLIPEEIKSKQKVIIICPYHGEFEQIEYNHRKGAECVFCIRERNTERTQKTTEQFIKDARKVHGDKFDYSKVEYKASHKKVTIICPEHGDFQTKPHNHLNGRGCSKCFNEK